MTKKKLNIKPKTKLPKAGNGLNTPIKGTKEQYQAYQDSLDLYNFGEKSINDLRNATQFDNSPLPENIKQIARRLKTLNGSVPIATNQLERSFIQPSGASYTNSAGHFTKPVQPIIYQPEAINPIQGGHSFPGTGTAWNGTFQQIQNQSQRINPLDLLRPKEQPINIQSAKPDLLHTHCPECEEWSKLIHKPGGASEAEVEQYNKLYPQYGNIETVPFKKGSYFTTNDDQQEQAGLRYWDKKTGRQLKKFGGLTKAKDGLITDPRQDSYYTLSSSDKQSIEQNQVRNIGKTVILPEVNITAPRAQYPTELGKRLQYSRDENQKLKDVAAEERWTNSYKGEQGLGNDIIGEQIGFGVLAKSLFSIKPIANELAGIGKNAIQNTYKINPFAKTEMSFTNGKLTNSIPTSNPEFIQRGVGTQEAIDDILNTGIVRNRQSAGLPSKNRWGEKVYWGEKDSPLASNKFNIIAKNSNGLENRPVTAKDIQDILVRNEQGNYTSLPNWQEQINKPHWLKGYKEVSQPASNFKSEINWDKWNSEIPSNQSLIKEYNAIEHTSKANNTWMKNPDGSAFTGTPEQFIQQNSSNFKKAFGDSKLVNTDGSPIIQYHGSAKKFNTFDESKFQLGDSGYSGQGIYTTPSKTTANSYAMSSSKFHTGNIEPTVYELYGQANNPISSSQLIKEGKGKDLFNFHREANWKGKLTPEESLMEYDAAIADQLPNVERVRTWNDAREVVFPTNRQLKSAVGNNGMFDMTNPNIYKGLAPIGIGAGIASQQEKKFGGNVNTDWEIVQDDNEWELV